MSTPNNNIDRWVHIMSKCTQLTIRHLITPIVLTVVFFLVLILDIVSKGWLLLAAASFAFYAVVLGVREILRRYIRTRLLFKYGEIYPGTAGQISGGGKGNPIFLHYRYSVGRHMNLQAKAATSGARCMPKPGTVIEILVLPGYQNISMPVLAYCYPWFEWVGKLFSNILVPIVILAMLLAGAALPIGIVIFWDKL